MHELILSAQQLSDGDLIEATTSCARRERHATAVLVARLSEMDARGLALREGYASLFDYCRRALGFSESETSGRVEAARAARRFPVVLDMLQAGELTMTTAMILGRHLTGENHQRLLQAARGKTKDQLKELVSALAPRPDVRVVLRRMPTAEPQPAAAAVGALSAPALVLPPLLQALARQRFRYQLTIDETTRDLLTAAKDLSAHGTDDAAMLKKSLELLVSDLARRKFAATDDPRPARGSRPDSRHVPAAVKREVWVRDAGRCAYVSPGGRRCEQRRCLEFHHAKPYEAGGEATTKNIRLRCRAHNQYEARVYFARDRQVGTPQEAHQHGGR
jgi:hypothetical protein